MKKENGFTLVELLAVVAILAILVIIALPNVMGMFNQAKENSFTTEIKEIYKVAQQQWMMDSMMSTKDQVYSRCESCNGNELQLSGRSQLNYYIKIDKAGKVKEYYANDGTYQYAYNSGDLRVEDIKEVKPIVDLIDSQIVKIDEIEPKFCVNYTTSTQYYNYNEGMTWNDYLDSSYNSSFAEYSYHDVPRGYLSTIGNKTGVCGTDMFYNGTTIQLEDKIMKSTEGCYVYNSPGVC